MPFSLRDYSEEIIDGGLCEACIKKQHDHGPQVLQLTVFNKYEKLPSTGEDKPSPVVSG
jgi:hypothetical protein